MLRFKMNEDGKFENVGKLEKKTKNVINETVTQIDTWKPTLDSIRQAFGMKNRKQNGVYQYDEMGNEEENYDGYTRRFEGKDINYIEEEIKKEKAKNDKKRADAKLKKELEKIKKADEEMTTKNKEEVRELIKEAVKEAKKD